MQGRSATRMKICCRVFLMMLAVAVLSVGALSKTTEKKKARSPGPPELKLRIVPAKEAYFQYERVFANAELVNLTGKTLCFPEPAQGVEVPDGYLTATAALLNPPEAEQSEDDQFVEIFTVRSNWPGEKLRAEIQDSWVKLAPNQVYVVKLKKSVAYLHFSGQWQLTATYQPPECSFGNCSKYLQSEAKKVGCTVPEIRVSTEPITVDAVPRPEQQSIK